jgi:hypothetical protein
MNGNGGMNGIFKMTDSSLSPSSVTTFTSPSTTLAGDDLENDIIEVPPPMDIQAQPKLSADTNVDKVTTDEPPSLVSKSMIPFKILSFFACVRQSCLIMDLVALSYSDQVTSKNSDM